MLLPSLVLLYLVLTNKSEIERFFDKEILKKIRIERGLEKNVKLVMLFLALGFMILALARPVVDKGERVLKKKSVPLVVAIDISPSMRARDLYPDRIRFAKRKLIEFLKKAQGFRVGVVAFSSEAFVVSPLSEDLGAVAFLVEHINPESVTLKGTSLSAAINSAASLLKKEEKKRVLLLSDGGEIAENEKIVSLLKRKGIELYFWGMGTLRGAPVPDGDGYMKDSRSNIVISRLNFELGNLLESEGVGRFIEASLSSKDIDRLLFTLNGLGGSEREIRVREYRELFVYLLPFSIVLMAAVFFSPPARGGVAVLCITLIAFASTKSYAFLLDFRDIEQAQKYYKKGNFPKSVEYFEKVARSKKSPYAYYDLANALYKAKRYKEAIKYYKMIETPNRLLEYYKLHNMGNAFFMLKDYRSAIESYKKALAIKEDQDTQANLRLAERMLKKSENSAKSGSRNRQEDKKEGVDNQGGKSSPKKDRSKGAKKSAKSVSNRADNRFISDREERKWLSKVKKIPQESLLIKDENSKGEDFGKPW